MNHKLLAKLAVTGMKKNQKTLVPFLVAGSITVMLFYILRSIAFSPYLYENGVEVFYGAKTIAILLEIGSQIVALFAIIFLFYANQFVTKGRKKEIGLYSVLGLSKRILTFMMMLETVIQGECAS